MRNSQIGRGTQRFHFVFCVTALVASAAPARAAVALRQGIPYAAVPVGEWF
jgi:hypothetical protein